MVAPRDKLFDLAADAAREHAKAISPQARAYYSGESVAMDAETLKALRGSIAKWERVVSTGASGTSYADCALCALFWAADCIGCPVSQRTGESHCDGSPFEDYMSERHELRLGSKERTSDPAVKEAAERELAFLKSLLPPPPITMLPNDKHPGPACSCRECLRDYPETP